MSLFFFHLEDLYNWGASHPCLLHRTLRTQEWALLVCFGAIFVILSSTTSTHICNVKIHIFHILYWFLN